MKVSSNVDSARDAVSQLASIDPVGLGQQVSIGSSNISGMQNAARVANQILRDVSETASGVKGQANSVTVLASKIEQRDRQDSSDWIHKA